MGPRFWCRGCRRRYGRSGRHRLVQEACRSGARCRPGYPSGCRRERSPPGGGRHRGPRDGIGRDLDGRKFGRSPGVAETGRRRLAGRAGKCRSGDRGNWRARRDRGEHGPGGGRVAGGQGGRQGRRVAGRQHDQGHAAAQAERTDRRLAPGPVQRMQRHLGPARPERLLDHPVRRLPGQQDQCQAQHEQGRTRETHIYVRPGQANDRPVPEVQGVGTGAQVAQRLGREEAAHRSGAHCHCDDEPRQRRSQEDASPIGEAGVGPQHHHQHRQPGQGGGTDDRSGRGAVVVGCQSPLVAGGGQGGPDHEPGRMGEGVVVNGGRVVPGYK